MTEVLKICFRSLLRVTPCIKIIGLQPLRNLEAKENVVVPSTFPRELEKREVSYTLFNLS